MFFSYWQVLPSFPPCRQVFEAYRNGKVEKAISFGFLFFIFSGDLTNFAGCYLTRQLPIQVNPTDFRVSFTGNPVSVTTFCTELR